MSQSIKLAVPTSGNGGLDAERSAHFGHADCFTIVDVVDGQIADSAILVNPPHSQGGCGMTVSLLANAGVGAAIVVGMGPGPLNAMEANGIEALFDNQSLTPRAAVERYLAEGLPAFGGDHVCQGH